MLLSKGSSNLFFAWVLLLSFLKVMYFKWNCFLLFNFANTFILATASHLFRRHWECATSLDTTIQNQSCTPRNPPCRLEPCFSFCLPRMFLPHRLQSTRTLLQFLPCDGHYLWEIVGTLHCCSEWCCFSLLWCVAVSFNKKLPAAYMVPARCSCMVLVWAASPSRLSAYSFVIGITVVALKKFFKHVLAWVLLLSSLKVMYLKWNYSYLFFAFTFIVATASHLLWRH